MFVFPPRKESWPSALVTLISSEYRSNPNFTVALPEYSIKPIRSLLLPIIKDLITFSMNCSSVLNLVGLVELDPSKMNARSKGVLQPNEIRQ